MKNKIYKILFICFLAYFSAVGQNSLINTNIVADADSIPMLRELGGRAGNSAYQDNNYTGIENTYLKELGLAATSLKDLIATKNIPDFKVFDFGAYNFISNMKEPDKRNDEVLATMENLIQTKYNCQNYLLIGKYINPADGKTSFRVALKLPTTGNTPILDTKQLEDAQKEILETANKHQTLSIAFQNKQSEEKAIQRCKTVISLLNCTVLGDESAFPRAGIKEGITSQGKVISEAPKNTNTIKYIQVLSGTVLYAIIGYNKYVTTTSTKSAPAIGMHLTEITEKLDRLLSFDNPLDLTELTGAGLVLNDTDAEIYVYRSYSECLFEYHKVNWKKGSTVLSIIPPSDGWGDR